MDGRLLVTFRGRVALQDVNRKAAAGRTQGGEKIPTGDTAVECGGGKNYGSRRVVRAG